MIVLVDTSIWIDHFRSSDARLTAMLLNGDVVCHPFVVGELACGNLKGRATVLSLLERLPQLPVATHAEVLHLVDRRKLMGRGLGWIDVHLLASALTGHAKFWTRDKRLAVAAHDLGLA